MKKYLDTRKSIIISSPAGSGKTEKLARRYVALLEAGSDVRRILAITFTEKAASEMKERILDILLRECPEMYEAVKTRIPLMRISTIHSLCLKLLKRFSVELGLDPSLSVADELTASTLWSEAVYEAIAEEKESPGLFFEMMRQRGIKGADAVMNILEDLYKKRPRPELIVKEGHPIEGEEEGRILALYMDCLERYSRKKAGRHLLDFSDLEVLAYEALSRGPEWHGILYAFDEHTDHLLVDEFQDTSTLQWKLIDKLTEEWRAGLGAKRQDGITPTVFLVGDEKQSIYHFRGANVSVFERAKERFAEWLGEEYRFEEVKENYRSLPEIVKFANELFSRLMPPGLLESWRTKYSPFEGVREGEGAVELILLEGAASTKRNRMNEARVLAKAVSALHGSREVFDGDSKRKCEFSDMVILLSRRTHLGVFEDALRKEGVPFIVQKGIGFYDEPEVALLREFISFVIDPQDDWSLFNLLRSPVFGMDYNKLLRLMAKNLSLMEALGEDKDAKDSVHAAGVLSSLLERRTSSPLAVLIEEMLTETRGWARFWERQRHANMKKLISMVESFEAEGRTPIEIREKLIRQRHQRETAKANINPEGMNAVRVMTVHAAKGLQFPIVFIPSLDEPNTPKTSTIALDDEPDRITFRCEPDSKKRRGIEVFERLKEKELEEEKRLFYVAVTRARDYLCMLGSMGEKPKGRLDYIHRAFGLAPGGDKPFILLREKDINERYGSRQRAEFEDAAGFMEEPAYVSAIDWEPEHRWLGVTEELDIRARHGEDWVVTGSVIHRLFEELSKGIITLGGIEERAGVVLKEEALGGEDHARILGIVREDIEKLSVSGHLNDIVMPIENSFSELPFHMAKGRNIFKGRIDRLIIGEGAALIYDYKTFPVKEREMPELIEKYRFQMEIYREAVGRLFGLGARAYLLFTHTPLLIEV